MRRPLVVVSLPVLVAGLGVLAVSVGLPAGCSSEPHARATRVQSRAELIGGPRALGEIGDWLLENDHVRFIIQDEGFSRGFGVFGGALLDADLVRPESGRGDSTGGQGRDNFGEMFPAFFLEALNPTQLPDPNDPSKLLPAIEVESTGGDGKDAVLVVRAVGDDFLAITQNVNETALADARLQPTFNFETRYILHPGAQYLDIDTTITNVSNKTVNYPQEIAGAKVPTPFGDVILFGAGNKVFTPNEAGFDMRFRLQDIYASNKVGLPALPGLVQEFVASASKDVSYGLMTYPPDAPAQNFAFANKDQFDRCTECGPPVTDHTIHVPFIASAFTGAFQVLPPPSMAPGDSFHVKRAFVVGDGDIASISDEVYGILKADTGQLTGRVQERQRPLFVEGAAVIIEDKAGNKVTEAASHKDGFFDAKLRPGDYNVIVMVPGQGPTAPVGVTIQKGVQDFETLFVDSPAEVVVTVVEANVGPVPAKATLVGTYDTPQDDTVPNKFLFDLSVGEPWRYTDLVPDSSDPKSRQFIETFATSSDGVIRLRARPGKYTLVVGRGMEYDTQEVAVTLEAGATKSVNAVIKRVVDSSGYASGDFHLHSQFSLDSGAKLDDRITSYAAAGLDYAVSTDHNYIVDYQPVIAKLGIEKFINSAVGIELTTIDRGHFQGYPLDRQPGALIAGGPANKIDTIASRTYGSLEWALKTPTQIFDELRSRGHKDAAGKVQPVVVQVNHPRDSILGYFDQYGVSAEDLTPAGITNPLLKPDDGLGGGGGNRPGRHPEFNKANFSFDFDALEVFNGKRYDFLHSFRVPPDAPTITKGDGTVVTVNPASCCEVTVGDVVLDPSSMKCRDGTKTCSCDADQLAFQIEQDNCKTGKIAFPGVIEDWMHLLMTGKHVVGTANSDSHEPEKEEPAVPRTYFGVGAGKDEPANLVPEDVVSAFTKGDVMMTNGPFVRVTATGDKTVGLGGTVAPKDGHVKLAVHVESAPWVKPSSVQVYFEDQLVDQKPVDGPGVHDIDFDLPVTADGFFLVEVTGTESEFPTVYPNEVPPLQFTDVIGSLGSSFGIGGSVGALKPTQIVVTSPYALTNPIWVDGNGDGEVVPSKTLPDPAAATHQDRPEIASVMKSVEVPWVMTEDEAAQKAWDAIPFRKRVALSRLPRWLWPSDDVSDVRRVLLQFVAHAD